MNHKPSTKYHGVSPYNGVYRVQLYRRGRVFYLGTYATDHEAAMAYDRAQNITKPWADRRGSYNFSTNELHVFPEDELNEREKKMVEVLRQLFPAQETAAQEYQAVVDASPEVLIEQISVTQANLANQISRLNGLVTQLQNHLYETVKLRLEAEEKLSWATDKVADLEAKTIAFSGVKVDPVTNKYVMTRIIPGVTNPPATTP